MAVDAAFLHRVLAALPEAQARQLRELVMADDGEPSWEEAEALLNELRANKLRRLIRAGAAKLEGMTGLEREIQQAVLLELELARRELLGETEGMERQLEEAKRRYEAIRDSRAGKSAEARAVDRRVG